MRVQVLLQPAQTLTMEQRQVMYKAYEDAMQMQTVATNECIMRGRENAMRKLHLVPCFRCLHSEAHAVLTLQAFWHCIAPEAHG